MQKDLKHMLMEVRYVGTMEHSQAFNYTLSFEALVQLPNKVTPFLFYLILKFGFVRSPCDVVGSDMIYALVTRLFPFNALLQRAVCFSTYGLRWHHQDHLHRL